jgi:fermentation-respiration switch protein FrsA (DUF1100 family)
MQSSKYKIKQLAAWGLTLVILGLAFFAVFKAKDIVSDELSMIPPAPARLALPDGGWETVRFSTADNVALAAWYAPSQNGQTIVVMHGFGANRSQVLDVSQMLRDQGFGVFTYDTRAHGESAGKEIGYGEKEVEDLRAAMDWLERRTEVDISRVGVYGFSLGGFIAAREAVGDKRISTLILAGMPSSIFELAEDESGGGLKGFLDASLRLLASKVVGNARYEHSGYDAVKALSESKRPLLFISGALDEVVPTARTQKLFEEAMEPKAIAIFENAGHGDYLKADRQRFQKLVVNHFKRSLEKRRDFSGR